MQAWKNRNPMRRGILYLGGLAVLALLSSWFLSTVESSLRESTPVDSELPVLYMDNFLATRMNVDGIREYTLASPHLVQLPGQGGTHLERPDIDVFADGQIRSWLIRAEQGWIAPQHEIIRLEEAVSITRPPASGKPPVVITTRNLVLHPDAGYAETVEPVRMETPDGVVDAIGLKAYLHEERLELLSEVRGNYAPPQP